MAVENYRIEESDYTGQGIPTTVVYIDSFDPEKFREITLDSKEKPDLRLGCAVRLASAKVITIEEFGECLKLIKQES